MQVSVKVVRGAFLNIFHSKGVGDDGAERFSGAFPIVPDSLNRKALDAAMQAVAKEKWKDKADTVMAELERKGRVCFKHEALRNKDGELYDGFEGMYSLNASNKTRPLVIDRVGITKDSDKEPGRKYTDPNKAGVMFPILTEQDGRPYGGCYVNLSIDVWAQDNSFGRRVNASLKGVQFHDDGDAFGGGSPASGNDFDSATVAAGADLV